jgi:hypothetical protein
MRQTESAKGGAEMRRTTLLLVLSALLAGVAGTLAGKLLSSSAPNHLVVLGPSVITSDRPDREQPFEHVFRLQNPTKGKISILEVHTGCACTVSELDSRTVEPGQVVALTARIIFFDSYARSYHQQIRVQTSAGDVMLHLQGDLPLPEKPLLRPQTVYLDALPDQSVIERSVSLRVPAQCCQRLTTDSVQISGCQGLVAELLDNGSSGLYRDFSLRIRVPADRAKSAIGELSLDTGCGRVIIAVKTTSKVLR